MEGEMPAEFFENPFLSLVKLIQGEKKPAEPWKGVSGLAGRPRSDFANRNIALITGSQFSESPERIYVLDFDKKTGGVELFNLLEMEDSQAFSGPFVSTPGGGFHYYFKSSLELPTKVALMPGLDFMGMGRYVAIPPSINAEGKAYVWFNELPEDLKDLPELPDWIAQKVLATGSRRVANPVEPGVWTEKDIPHVRNMLMNSDPAKWNGAYDNWLDIGFAIHHGFSGSEEGLELWEEATRHHCPAPDSADECEHKYLRFDANKVGGKSYKSLPSLVGQCVQGFDAIPNKPIAEVSPGKKKESKYLKKEELIKEVVKAIGGDGKSIRINEISAAIELDGKILSEGNGEELWLTCRDYGKEKDLKQLTQQKDFDSVLKILGERNRFNAIEDYIKSAHELYKSAPRPSHTARTDELFHKLESFWEGSPEELTWFRRCFEFWALGCVAKALGQHQNVVLTIKGGQGGGKTSFAKALAKNMLARGQSCFVGVDLKKYDKDDELRLAQNFIWELGDYRPRGPRELSSFKNLTTLAEVNTRMPYGRMPVCLPIKCSFMITTNDQTFLSDTTGNRRFLVCEFLVGRTEGYDLSEWVLNHFDNKLFWGEMAERLAREGRSCLRMTPEMMEESTKRAEGVRQVTPLEALIEDILSPSEGGFVSRKELRTEIKDAQSSLLGYYWVAEVASAIAKRAGKTISEVEHKRDGERGFKGVVFTKSLNAKDARNNLLQLQNL
jgi:hypothetical protein